MEKKLTPKQKQKKAEQEKLAGNSAYNQGNYSTALRHYEASLELEPNNGAVCSNKALVLLQLGFFSEAKEEAEKVIVLKPLWEKGYFRKGVALLGLNDFHEAQESFNKALEIAPNNKEIKDHLELSKNLLTQSFTQTSPFFKSTYSKFVSLIRDPSRGITYVAKVDIPAGHIILVEEPLVYTSTTAPSEIKTPKDLAQFTELLIPKEEFKPIPELSKNSDITWSLVYKIIAALTGDNSSIGDFLSCFSADRPIQNTDKSPIDFLISVFPKISEVDLWNLNRLVLTNCYERRSALLDKSIGTGIYPFASYFNHSCRPNCEFYFVQNNAIKIVARTKIIAGTELCVSYIPSIDYLPLPARKTLIRELLSFECVCRLCVFESTNIQLQKPNEKYIESICNAHRSFLNRNYQSCLDILNSLRDNPHVTKEIYVQISLPYMMSCYHVRRSDLGNFAHNFIIYSDEFGAYKPSWRFIIQNFIRFIVTEEKGDHASSLRAEFELVNSVKKNYSGLEYLFPDRYFDPLIDGKLNIWDKMEDDLDVEKMIKEVGQLFAVFKEDPSKKDSFLKK